MITTVLCIFGIPMFLATLAIAPIARWQWRKTMDAVLRTMDYSDVEKRVKEAQVNDTGFIAHVGIWGMVLLASMTTRAWVNLASGWVLFIMIHGLSLYLYHVRWNPNTLQRKQKLDAENTIYDGNYALDPTMRYGVNEEGELVPLIDDTLSTEHQKASS